MVIVDSDVWSEAFRRKTGEASWQVQRLASLIQTEEAQLVGLIRHEVLSGIRNEARFGQIRDALRAFPDVPISSAIYELAASYFNVCRARGIQGTHTDFLICACARSWDMRILSKDRDYEHYARYIPIKLEKE